MTYDVLGPARLLNASAFSFQSGAIARTLAGLAGGIALDRLGVAPAYFIVAALFVGSGVALLPLRVARRATEATREASLAALRAGLAYARRTRAVRELLTLSAITEVFGFACLFVLPVLARDVLGVSATGLGALTSASAAGQFVAMTGLSLAGDFRRKGALLAGSTLAFGLAVVTLSLSSAFVLSLALMFLFGAAASLYDTLENQIVPLYYEYARANLSHAWMHRVKSSIASLAPNFSTRRMVKQYVEEMYLAP